MRLRHMDPGVGASFGLSVVVVVLAAVALHPVARSTHRAALASPGPTVPPEHQPDPAPTPAASEPQPPAPVVDHVAVSPPAVTSTRAGSAPAARSLARPPARPVSRRAQDGPARRPSSAFIDVAEGESLADVARRVYGSADAAAALWRANRDQVEQPDAPLSAGTLLRRP
ncbi:MAG TPA: hypothetical protein VGZ22_10820 [Isosphaeraceae bacterium]|jgi:hypothetical protein|nr:hypothetical protein [Isosphaeraceae bacterium]